MNLGTYATLEDEARQLITSNQPEAEAEIDQELAAHAVALSTAVSLRRIADSLRAIERSGLVTRNRAI